MERERQVMVRPPTESSESHGKVMGGGPRRITHVPCNVEGRGFSFVLWNAGNVNRIFWIVRVLQNVQLRSSPLCFEWIEWSQSDASKQCRSVFSCTLEKGLGSDVGSSWSENQFVQFWMVGNQFRFNTIIRKRVVSLHPPYT